jgi:hypothetical protein
MKSKSKSLSEPQFLELLQKVLPQATPDARLASAIYNQVAQEIRRINQVKSLEKFCAEGSLPDTKPATIAEFQGSLAANFGPENVSLTPTEAGDAVTVEVTLPDRQIKDRIRIKTGPEELEEVKVPHVPFPVALPEDPELLWVLARREDFGPDEAARALAVIEEEFWESKAGQKLLRDRVEKTFAEFIANVPAAALAERGLKRHYKAPEPRQTLRRLVPGETVSGKG